MASVSGSFFWLRFGHLFRGVAQLVEFGTDRLCRWQLLVRRAKLRHQLAAHLCCRQACGESFCSELRVGLALPIHDGCHLFEQMRQMLFTAFAASPGVRIETDDAALSFVLAFANRAPIPAQFSFG